MTYQTSASTLINLPHPDHQSEFYEGTVSKRLFAWVIDAVIVMILVAVALPFTGFLGLLILPVMFLVLGFAYRVITLTGRSATWGMRMMAVEFRQSNGQRFDLGAAFLHTLGYTISMSIPVLQVISVVLMLTTARGQGLTDHVMGTVALNQRL